MTLHRRDMLRLLASAPMAAGLVWTEGDAAEARARTQAAKTAGGLFKPKFFTAHEYATVSVLVDLLIPRDERSGSATDAGVPEFMDFILDDQPTRQTAMRGGLAWIDVECEKRFDKTFLDCNDKERAALLDDISWPQRATPALSQGVAFFSRFRDLTASGFWTSKMGMADLQYMGNTVVHEWNGCPEPVLKKLGLTSQAD